MKKRPVYSPEVRERAVRLVLTTENDHNSRWAAITSVATKIGCTSETLRAWINRVESSSAAPCNAGSAELERIKALERENREFRTIGGQTPINRVKRRSTISKITKGDFYA